MAFGTDPTPDGLANPPIDDLMKHADSKYALAIFAAKRARQINSYFTQLNEGLLQNIGPLVEYQNNEKPLSIAFREIDEGLLGRGRRQRGQLIDSDNSFGLFGQFVAE